MDSYCSYATLICYSPMRVVYWKKIIVSLTHGLTSLAWSCADPKKLPIAIHHTRIHEGLGTVTRWSGVEGWSRASEYILPWSIEMSQGSRVTCSSLQRGHVGSTEVCLRLQERYVTSSQESVRLLAALKSFDQEYLPYCLLTSGVSVDGKGTTLLRRR